MNQIKIQGVCTCVPQFSYEKDRRGRSVPTCRYILAVQRPKSSYSDYMYCVAFGERAMIAFQKIKKGTTVFVQGHLHTEEGRDANNQKVYFVTVTVDYQQIIEKQEFNGLELCTGLPQFPVLKQEEKGGKQHPVITPGYFYDETGTVVGRHEDFTNMMMMTIKKCRVKD